MLKIFIALLITIEILLIPLIIFFFSGVSVLLPGLGLVVAGSLISILLIIIEVVLLATTLILWRKLSLTSGRLP